MRAGLSVIVALLVVLSGCSSVVDTTPSPTTTSVRSQGTPSPADTPTQSTGSSVDGSTPPSEHPWADDTVIVAITDSMPGPRSFTPIVREALSAWNGTQVEGGTVHFRVVPNASAPDLIVTIQPRIRACGEETTDDSFNYCVPHLTHRVTADPTETAILSGRFANDTLLHVAKGGFALLVDRQPEHHEGYRYADPWPSSYPVVVNVTNRANSSRAFTPLVRQAIEWWAKRPASEKNYTTRFVLRPDAAQADVHVQLVRSIETCGIEDSDDFIGCADLLNQRTLADNATVRVEAGYTNASTLHTLKHEFGHIYGRRHGQPPIPVMNETQTNATLWPKPNATDRELPWQNRTLTVFVDANGTVDADTAWSDIDPAFRYFERGADGWLRKPPTFERTRNASRADIVVHVTDDPVCGFEYGGVCHIRWNGTNLDSDPALEFYTHEELTVTSTERTARAWMTGYAAAFVLGAANQSEMPRPLQDSENADEEWWR